MNEEKKTAALDESSLEAVSGGLNWAKPQFRGPVAENASTDQANGQLIVDGNMKQP